MKRTALGRTCAALTFLVVLASAVRASAQAVPPVGPSHCVMYCGGAPGGFGAPGGQLNMGGMLGGIFTSVLGGLLIDALSRAASQPAAPGVQPGGPPPARFDGLQQAFEQQRRFQEERERRLLAALSDTSANRLLDASSSLTLLEPQAQQARLGFDTALDAEPDDAWMRLHDPWFSSQAGEAGQALGARPLAIGDDVLEYSEVAAEPVQCMATLGGQLCAFPSGQGPAVTLEPAPLTDAAPVPLGGDSPVLSGPTLAQPASPVSPPGPAVGSQPAAPPAARPAAPPRPVAAAQPGEAGAVRIEGDVPRLLGRGAPDPPWTPRLDAATVSPSPGPCDGAVVFEDRNVFVGAVRQQLEALDRDRQDPRTWVEILTTTVIDKLPVLPAVQAAGAKAAIGTYRSFVGQLLCKTFSMLGYAPLRPDLAAAESADILEGGGLAAAAAQRAGLPLTGSASGDLEALKRRVGETLRDLPSDALKNRLKGAAAGQSAELAGNVRDNLWGDADRFTMKPLVEKMKDLTLSPEAFRYQQGYRAVQEFQQQLSPPAPRAPEGVRSAVRGTADVLDDRVLGEAWKRGMRRADEVLKDYRKRLHHWLVSVSP